MLLELGVFAAFGAMLCWGIGDFLIQRTTRKIGDIETLAFIGLMGAIGLLPFVVYEIPLILEPQNLMLLAVLGLITFVAAILDFEALKKGKLSVVEIILEIELPVTVVLGFIFFRESLSLLQTAAVFSVLGGILLIAAGSSPSRKFGRKLEKGVFLAILAAVSMGFVNFLTAAGSKQASPLLVIWMPWLIVALMAFPVLMKREGLRKTFRNASNFKLLIIATGIFDTAAWLFFAFAVFDNMLSITIAITESYPAVALLLGLWLNKEKIAVHQYAGAGIALAASIALGFLI
jgi:drug/metabolite transporter (DMT)-like permease